MSQVSIDRIDVSWSETLARVRAFVAARVGDDELAADITQDVVVRSIASGALERVDNPAELPAALSRALTVVRQEKRQALLNVICGAG